MKETIFSFIELKYVKYDKIFFSIGKEGSLPEMPPGTYYKPKFFDFMLEEYYACRESVGIIDMSSFSKMKIQVPVEYCFINNN